MPKPTKGARLGGSATHERMMLRNLTGQLIEHGRITTTETKARRVQPLAEKVITKAKRGDLHSRRLVLATLFDKKKKPIMEYPVRAMHYTASSTAAAPFFPDGKFLQERNDTFFNTVRDGFKAFVSGESAPYISVACPTI